MVVHHLSRLELPKQLEPHFTVINENFSSERILAISINNSLPWYADYVNFLVGKITPPNVSYIKKEVSLLGKTLFFEESILYQHCVD